MPGQPYLGILLCVHFGAVVLWLPGTAMWNTSIVCHRRILLRAGSEQLPDSN